MLTIRTMGGVALLLFGSTFLWITPEFVTRGLPNTGVWWRSSHTGWPRTRRVKRRPGSTCSSTPSAAPVCWSCS